MLRCSLECLPDSGHQSSRIQLDLLIFCGSHLDDKVTVKQLITSIPSSDAGTRKHFEFLLEAGFVKLEGDPDDRRIRYVAATEKLDKLLDRWANVGTGLAEDYVLSESSEKTD